MKTKIIEALKTKFGVEEKALVRIATKLAKTITSEDEIQTAIDGVEFQQILESYGDARATEAQKTAISNYEKQHGLKDGKVAEIENQGEKPTPAPGDDEPSWAKQMREQMEAMQKQIYGFQAEKLGDSRKAKLATMLKDAPESVKAMYENNFAAITFENDEQFDVWCDTNTKVIEGLTNDMRTKGAIVRPPKGGSAERKPGDADPLVVARAERVQKEAESAPSVFMGGVPNK